MDLAPPSRSNPATRPAGVGARKTVEYLPGQHFYHAVQDERHKHELVDCAKYRQREIRRLDSEERQDSQPGQQPPRTTLMPDREPKQAQVLAGDHAPQCKDAFQGVLLQGLGRFVLLIWVALT